MEVFYLVIAIQKELESIKDELESRGHEVFYIGENRIADAILYKDADTYHYYAFNNASVESSSSINNNTSYGTLLVNITNKSMDDIMRIIEKRVYSPII
jgi:hypothetical protein